MPKEAGDATVSEHNTEHKRSKLRKFVVPAVVILAIVFGFLWLTNDVDCTKTNCSSGLSNNQSASSLSSVRLPNGTTIGVELADTEAKRQLGLGGRDFVGSSGMMFVFGTPFKYGIWMKNMKISIDIVWLDSDKTVISVEKNVSPATYPKVFYPTGDALYVLEVAANQSVEFGLVTGAKLSW